MPERGLRQYPGRSRTLNITSQLIENSTRQSPEKFYLTAKRFLKDTDMKLIAVEDAWPPSPSSLTSSGYKASTSVACWASTNSIGAADGTANNGAPGRINQ